MKLTTSSSSHSLTWASLACNGSSSFTAQTTAASRNDPNPPAFCGTILISCGGMRNAVSRSSRKLERKLERIYFFSTADVKVSRFPFSKDMLRRALKMYARDEP